MRVVVLGIGNILLSDEGVGVRAIEELTRRYRLPAEILVIDGGTCGMELLDQLAGADLLLIADAVRVGQPPASVVRMADDEVPAFFKTKLSPHQVGISDVLATLILMGEPARRVVLIGVQPVSFATGIGLTPAVTAVLDRVVGLLVDELAAAGMAVVPLAA